MTQSEDEAMDRYLSGDMDAKGKKIFEARLNSNTTLREHLAVRKKLYPFIADGEADMRSFLKDFGKETFGKDNSAERKQPLWRRLWPWLLAALLALTTVAFWWMNDKPEEEPSSITQPAEPEGKIPSVEEDSTPASAPTENPPETEAPPSSNPAPATAPQKSPPSSPKEPEPREPVYAALDPANFTPNPMLEDIISGQLRGEADKTTFTNPIAGDTLGQEPFFFNGKTSSSESLEVVIYSNDQARFDAGQPVFSIPLNVEQEEFSTPVSGLVPGRYYILILNEMGDLVAGSHFFVFDNQN